MHPAVERVKTEGRKVLVTAVFFSAGFIVLVLHNRLLVEGSQIQIASYARALFGGLIAAKVLLSIDILPFFDAFPHKPMIYNIGWKTSLYTIGAVVYLYADPLVRHLIRGTGLSQARHQAWQQLMLPRTWAILIWVVGLLLVFVTMKEISRVIGNDAMRHMFFGHRSTPATDVRPRKAA